MTMNQDQKTIDQLSNDYRRLWRQQPISVEDFLSQSSLSLEASTQAAIRLIKHEIELRRSVGESCAAQEYKARFPRLDPEVLNNLFSMPAPPPVSVLKPLLPNRYEPIKQIGKGGIGSVWQVDDRDMDRTLAVKVLHTKLEKETSANLRLKREAMLTGSLQHPGIPPVFEYGSLVGGSNYFTMKLVEGETLDRTFEKQSGPELLAIFRQVAEAVGFAHSRNVIHRDLKPQNIMVGAFGEVQIMDWGLAKDLNAKRPAEKNGTAAPKTSPQSEIETSDNSIDSSYVGVNSELTRHGDVVGTPAYMSPEQALGELDSLGPATDVYSLGAMLFEILTGNRWYRVRPDDSDAERVKAVLKTNLDSDEIAQPLATLCEQCLDQDQAKRPSNGTEVAQLIADYQSKLAQRLKETEIERAKAETAAIEVKKQSRLRLGIIAALALAGIIGVASFARYQNEQAENRRKLLSNFAVAENRIEIFRDRGDFETANQTLASITQEIESSGESELLDQATILEKDNQIIQDLDLARHLRRSADDPKEKWVFQKSGGDVAPYRKAIYSAIGDIEKESQEDVVARLNASAIKRHLIAGIDDWAVIEPDPELAAKLLAINIASDPDPIRSKIRDKDNWKNREVLLELAKSVDVAEVDASTLLMLANNLHLLPEPEADRVKQMAFDFRFKNVATREALLLLERALPFHQEDFWMQMQIGYMMEYLELHHDASAHFMAATAARPDQPDALYRLARHKLQSNRFTAARATADRLVRLSPIAKHYALKGMIVERFGKIAAQPTDGAEEHYKKAVEVAPKEVASNRELGIYYLNEGKFDLAIPLFETALNIDSNDVVTRFNFAKTLRAVGKHSKAETILRPVIDAEQQAFYEAYIEFGEILLNLERYSEAKSSFEKAKGTFFLRDGPKVLEDIENRIEESGEYPRIWKEYLASPDSISIAEAMKLGRFYISRGLRPERMDKLFGGVWEQFSATSEKLAGRDAWDLGDYFNSKEGPKEKIATLYKHALETGADEFSSKELKLRHYNAACVALSIGDTDDQENEWRKFAMKNLVQSIDEIEKELKPFKPGTSEHDVAYISVIKFLESWKEDPDLTSIREDDAKSTSELWARHELLLKDLREKMTAGKD